MKVLHFSGIASNFFGGASRYIEELIMYLNVNGLEAYLIHDYRDVYYMENHLSNIFFKRELSTFNIIKFSLNLYFIYNFVKINNIKLIHTNHRNDIIYASIIKLLIPKIILIHTIHGKQVFNEEKKLHYRIIRIFSFFSLNHLYSEIVYITNSVFNSSKGVIYNKNQQVILNGTGKLRFCDSYCAKLIEKYNINQEKFIISWIGYLGGCKRIDILLNICKSLKYEKNIIFLVIGIGEGYKQIQSEMEEFELENIRLLGSQKSIGNIYKISNAVISTAIGEGFGRTLTEAMSFSLPTIAFNTDGPTEIIINNYNGFLVEPENIEDYIIRIIELKNNKKLYKLMCDNAKKIFEERFTIERFGNEHVELYNKYIEKK